MLYCLVHGRVPAVACDFFACSACREEALSPGCLCVLFLACAFHSTHCCPSLQR